MMVVKGTRDFSILVPCRAQAAPPVGKKLHLYNDQISYYLGYNPKTSHRPRRVNLDDSD